MKRGEQSGRKERKLYDCCVSMVWGEYWVDLAFLEGWCGLAEDHVPTEDPDHIGRPTWWGEGERRGGGHLPMARVDSSGA